MQGLFGTLIGHGKIFLNVTLESLMDPDRHIKCYNVMCGRRLPAGFPV